MLSLNDIKEVSLHADVVEAKDFKDNFVEYWATALLALDLLKSAVKNPIVKMIIGLVINVGNALAEKWAEDIEN